MAGKIMSKLVPSGGNDRVYTPPNLALSIVDHFSTQIKKKDIILDPCKGKGAFTKAFRAKKYRNVRWCEIDKGKDFFAFTEKVDWIITNPPWSLMRQFMEHSYTISNNQVWLVTVNHVIALKRRLVDMEREGFGIKEILLVDTPPTPWPQSGFQLGACHIQKDWYGAIDFKRLVE